MIALIIGGLVLAVLTIAVCASCVRRTTPTPVSTTQSVEPVEKRDCDEEDRIKKDWMDCGLGVLKPSTKPVIKSPAPPAGPVPLPRRTRR